MGDDKSALILVMQPKGPENQTDGLDMKAGSVL